MKFKFSQNLDYQLEAINSIVDIFDTGKNLYARDDTFQLRSPSASPVVANELEIEDGRILSNVQRIQEQNNIEPVERLDSYDFTVEMETGTGKTYVYLRTALELHKRYGLTKFIILVPSVAIREGVMKTIQQTKEHFQKLYNFNFNDFAYDSSKLSEVRDFIQSPDIQFMVMTIQSFNKDTNVMRQTPDRFHGEQPLELVAQTRPVVIMDEPQNMGSDLAKASIEDLHPLFKLRYSATHKEVHNLMYQLTPVNAYKNGLVKKISVYGAKEEDSGAFVFEVKDIKIERGRNPRAKVKVEERTADGSFVKKEKTVKAGDDLERKTGNEKYSGVEVNEVDARRARVELSNGSFYKLQEQTLENKEAVFRTQIRETIKAHLDKQDDLGDRAKVLSLFFIDKVENYRGEDALIKKIFEQEFERLKSNYGQFSRWDASQVHSGYFAQDRESEGRKKQEIASEKKRENLTYDLIMKDKERLLSFEEPVSFIFSHSALREGWDNPNVFQICTLNETKSEHRKRQEVGRGLRLPVDVNGYRIFDSRVNVLTVVANESYEEFVGQLQTQYSEAGYGELPQPGNARRKVNVNFRKNIEIENEEFKQLWERIRKKTKYNISFPAEKFVEHAAEEINERIDINNISVRVQKVDIDFDKKGKMKTIYAGESAGESVKSEVKIGNVVDRIVRETGVTKKTVVDILSRANNLDLIFKNPEEYIRSVGVIIKHTLHEFVINEGLRYTPVDDVWELDIFESFKSSQNKTIKSDKSVYERVVFDSAGEREFAESLEASSRVALYTKLPPKFVIDTPLGTYNPDWAIVMKGEDNKERLYLIRETKFAENRTKQEIIDNLRQEEKQKIECGRKHFNAIGVDFGVSTDKNLGDLK
jgi:type III restriction enzyme